MVVRSAFYQSNRLAMQNAVCQSNRLAEQHPSSWTLDEVVLPVVEFPLSSHPSQQSTLEDEVVLVDYQLVANQELVEDLLQVSMVISPLEKTEEPASRQSSRL